MRTPTKALLALAFTALGTWFYFTPHIAAYGMKTAAQAKDSAKLTGYIDFPALKENLKAGLQTKFQTQSAPANDNSPMGAMGNALASAFITSMVDALVTPNNLAAVMQGDKPRPIPHSEPAKPAAQTAAEPDTVTTTAYESWDRFVVTIRKKGHEDKPVGLVFHRHGLVTWKLDDLQLPL
jgi:hypothetical protein